MPNFVPRRIADLPLSKGLFITDPSITDERADSIVGTLNELSGDPLGQSSLRKSVGSDDVLTALEDKQAEYPRAVFDWVQSAQASATGAEQVRDQSLSELPVNVNLLEAQLEAMRTAFAEAEGRQPTSGDTAFVEAAGELIRAHVAKGTAVNKSRGLVGAAIRKGPTVACSRVEIN